jgi:hypothetical protein
MPLRASRERRYGPGQVSADSRDPRRRASLLVAPPKMNDGAVARLLDVPQNSRLPVTRYDGQSLPVSRSTPNLPMSISVTTFSRMTGANSLPTQSGH